MKMQANGPSSGPQRNAARQNEVKRAAACAVLAEELAMQFKLLAVGALP